MGSVAQEEKQGATQPPQTPTETIWPPARWQESRQPSHPRPPRGVPRSVDSSSAALDSPDFSSGTLMRRPPPARAETPRQRWHRRRARRRSSFATSFCLLRCHGQCHSRPSLSLNHGDRVRGSGLTSLRRALESWAYVVMTRSSGKSACQGQPHIGSSET